MSWRNLALSTFTVSMMLSAKAESGLPPNDSNGTSGTPPIVTVGSDAACDYANITQAMFAAAAPLLEIRVAKNIAITTTQTILGRNVRLVGGYATCSSTTPSGHTTLQSGPPGPSFTGSVLRTNASFAAGNAFTASLSGFTITNGTGSASLPGGGMTIDGPFQVVLSDTYVQFNTTTLGGGGIAVRGQAVASTNAPAGGDERTKLIVQTGSIVSGNTAATGGGIWCSGDAFVGSVDSQIASNVATGFNGGGIYSQQCNVVLAQHGPFQGVLSNAVTGIGGAGGGIYASGGSVFAQSFGIQQSVVDSNSADYGGGIYAVAAQVTLSDATVTNNTAVIRGGGINAVNSTTIVERTYSSSTCHHALRCSELSGNRVTGTGSTANGGGLFASGGVTRISGTFIENNRVGSGRGMAVAVLNAPGSGGLSPDGLRIFGSVIATSGTGGPAAGSDSSVVHIENSSAALGFDTFSRNLAVPRIVYTPTTGSTIYEVAIYGSIFDAASGVVASPGASGAVPYGDCNRLHETTSTFATTSTRSTALAPTFVNAAAGDYGLDTFSPMLDWCDASYGYSIALSANGGVRPYDDPNFTAVFGNYDLGALERQPLDVIFKHGFE